MTPSDTPRGGPRRTDDGDADVAADLAPYGVLRASINLGNPVLAQGTASEPSGVTVDIARELAARLGVPVQFVCFEAARDSFEAMLTGDADLCFLAIDPAREESVAFTAAYAVIEGVFAVPADSAIVSSGEVDRPGIRVGVKQGSAYDLFLSRTLEQAEPVRGIEGTQVFLDELLEVAAGIRQPVTDFAAQREIRVLEPAFMEIRQAVGTGRSKNPSTIEFLHDFVEELKSSGFIAAALERSGRRDAQVAPASDRTSRP